jgi:hypothetical protein
MPLADIFARSRYEPEQELDAAIAKVEYNINDVKHVVMGHLHLGEQNIEDKQVQERPRSEALFPSARSCRRIGSLDRQRRSYLGPQGR